LTATGRHALMQAARTLARELGESFTGNVEFHVHRGTVGTVKVVQSFHAAADGAERGDG
jgi:hypothetical protein